MTRQIDAEFERELLDAAVGRRLIRLGALAASAGIRDLHGYVDELAVRQDVTAEDLERAHAAIEARKRRTRIVVIGAWVALIVVGYLKVHAGGV